MPKIWPKEGQNFPKYKKFKILSGDENNHSKKKSLFAKTNKKLLRSFIFWLW